MPFPRKLNTSPPTPLSLPFPPPYGISTPTLLARFTSPSLQSHRNNTSHSTNKHAADLVRTSSASDHGRLGRIDRRSSCEAAVWCHDRRSVSDGQWIRV